MTISFLLLDINPAIAYFTPNRAAPLKKTIGVGDEKQSLPIALLGTPEASEAEF